MEFSSLNHYSQVRFIGRIGLQKQEFKLTQALLRVTLALSFLFGECYYFLKCGVAKKKLIYSQKNAHGH